MGFAKLDDEFAGSSLLVQGGFELAGLWAVLLSMKGREGRVYESIPMLARRGGATPERIADLLHILASPDPHSRTPDHEGRRIVIEREPRFCIVILNHARFTERDETAAERQRRYRERLAQSRSVTRDNGKSRLECGLQSTSLSNSPTNSVSVDGGMGETTFYRPGAADRAERAVTEEIRRLQLILGGKLAELSEHPNSREMVPAWTRRVTAYDRQDGSRAKGVADYRTLTSIPWLEKSIEDADYWLKKLEQGPLEAKRGA